MRQRHAPWSGALFPRAPKTLEIRPKENSRRQRSCSPLRPQAYPAYPPQTPRAGFPPPRWARARVKAPAKAPARAARTAILHMRKSPLLHINPQREQSEALLPKECRALRRELHTRADPSSSPPNSEMADDVCCKVPPSPPTQASSPSPPFLPCLPSAPTPFPLRQRHAAAPPPPRNNEAQSKPSHLSRPPCPRSSRRRARS